MSKLNTGLGWGERLAIMEHFSLDDKTAMSAMNVTRDEIFTARELAEAGTIAIANEIDFDQYADELSVSKSSAKSNSATSTSKPGDTGPAPVTATKPIRTPKKRGRKGDKIKNAFQAIPSDPTDANVYINEHGISMNVLRQSKRFDKSGTPGVVHVRKDKDTGNLMVWRSEPSK